MQLSKHWTWVHVSIATCALILGQHLVYADDYVRDPAPAITSNGTHVEDYATARNRHPATAQGGNTDPNAGLRGEYILRYDLTSRGEKYAAAFGLPKDWGKGLCPAFTANLNQFRRLDFNTCDPRLSPKYPRFSRLQWEEIPLDLVMAKKIMDIRHAWWEGWLKATAADRAAGKVKMWRLQVDLLADGHLETLVSLDRAYWGENRPSCRYTDSFQMLTESTDPKIADVYATQPPMLSVLGNDLIHDSDSKRYYLLEWNRLGAAHANGEDAYIFGYQGGKAISNIGATASVVLYTPTVRGAIPTCWVDWVPTGNRKP